MWYLTTITVNDTKTSRSIALKNSTAEINRRKFRTEGLCFIQLKVRLKENVINFTNFWISLPDMIVQTEMELIIFHVNSVIKI